MSIAASLDHDEMRLFLELALQTTEELHRLGHDVALGHPVPAAAVLDARRRLDAQLAALRRLAAQDVVRFEDDDERDGEEALARINQFEQLRTPG